MANETTSSARSRFKKPFLINLDKTFITYCILLLLSTSALIASTARNRNTALYPRTRYKESAYYRDEPRCIFYYDRENTTIEADSQPGECDNLGMLFFLNIANHNKTLREELQQSMEDQIAVYEQNHEKWIVEQKSGWKRWSIEKANWFPVEITYTVLIAVVIVVYHAALVIFRLWKGYMPNSGHYSSSSASSAGSPTFTIKSYSAFLAWEAVVLILMLYLIIPSRIYIASDILIPAACIQMIHFLVAMACPGPNVPPFGVRRELQEKKKEEGLV